MQTLVSIDNAQCRIGRQALLAIGHFAIEPGQHWCLFGPNGCGKTLLANLLAGKRLESGNYVSYGPNFDPALDLHIVSFEEQQRLWARDNRLDISEFSGDAQDKGTVVEDLIRASRSKQSQNDVLLADLIEQLALAEVLSKGIRFLSSGQIRKVLIARSLYAYRDGLPQLLILDDPLESIDRDSREQIKSTIEKAMSAQFSSLHLCRRRQDILPGVSHMAVMQRNSTRMQIDRQGSLAEVLKTSEFADVGVVGIEATANLDELLPHETPIRKRSEELIRLEDVQASYGDSKVLVDVNWIMTGRDHVVIEGPNGSGKSTLLSLIDGENHKGYGQQVFLFGRLKGEWRLQTRTQEALRHRFHPPLRHHEPPYRPLRRRSPRARPVGLLQPTPDRQFQPRYRRRTGAMGEAVLSRDIFWSAAASLACPGDDQEAPHTYFG